VFPYLRAVKFQDYFPFLSFSTFIFLSKTAKSGIRWLTGGNLGSWGETWAEIVVFSLFFTFFVPDRGGVGVEIVRITPIKSRLFS